MFEERTVSEQFDFGQWLREFDRKILLIKLGKEDELESKPNEPEA